MACKDGYQGTGALRDEHGNYVGFFINGTDETYGVIDMTALVGDFVPVMSADHSDDTFRVCIEAVGVLEVQLADETDFTVTLVQTTKYLGDWLPLNIIKVYESGTTADFSVGW
jgi:hypothetical protein